MHSQASEEEERATIRNQDSPANRGPQRASAPIRPQRKKSRHREINESPAAAMMLRPSSPPPPIPPREHSSPLTGTQLGAGRQHHVSLRKTPSLQSSRSQQSDAPLPPHDLSQDSGVVSGASPAFLPASSFNDPHVIEVALQPASTVSSPRGEERDATRVSLRSGRAATSPSGSGRWKLPAFFKRGKARDGSRDRSKSDSEEQQHFKQLIVKEAHPSPPALPPRVRPVGFEPTLSVRPETLRQEPLAATRASSLPGHYHQHHHKMHSPTVPALSPFGNYDNGLYFYGDGCSHQEQQFHPSLSEPRMRTSWKEQKEDMMQRVEAKRNSFRDSSSDDEGDPLVADDGSSQCSFGNRSAGSINNSGHKRSSRRSHWRRSREFTSDVHQAQIDVLNRINQIQGGHLDTHPVANSPAYTATPPPPPPRDPRRRLHLVRSDNGRPLSYSFEPIPSTSSPAFSCDEPSDLGVPIVPRPQHLRLQSPLVYQPQYPYADQSNFAQAQLFSPPEIHEASLLRNPHLSLSEQHLDDVPGVQHWSQNPQGDQDHEEHQQRWYQSPPSSQGVFGETPRSRKAIHSNKALPPTTAQDSLLSRKQPHHASQPSLNQPLPSNPPAEYWKVPPPFGAIPLHHYDRARLAFSDDNSRDCSPQRPLRKKTSKVSVSSGKHTSRDSVLSPQQSGGSAVSSSSIEKSGKSSPSSISSKDSGCSETQRQQQMRPLATVVEKSESTDMVNGDAKSSLTRKAPPSPKQHSPVRSSADDPGFSTKERRCKFREAMHELEDVLTEIQRDADLFDRAERRDLPTAHQELIAQARERFQGGASEETSRHDGDDSAAENAYSDLDAFMNWNTSSSFENLDAAVSAASPVGFRISRQNSTNCLPRRPRTPSNRRSGRYDKRTDDMVYRICKANNRPVQKSINPITKVDQSFLLLSPAMSPAPTSLALEVKGDVKIDEGEEEPDILRDDVTFRYIRDVNSGNISDPQPKFGIPKTPSDPCSDRDYLHARPSETKYRSTFNPMKNPDLVLDDLAFRTLRKDESFNDPVSLGNRDLGKPDESDAPSAILHQKRAEDEDRNGMKKKIKTDPYVFYPNKHNEVMKTLSEHIAQLIRRQAGSPGGGAAEQIVTYEDLKNPAVYQAMRYTLNIIDAEEMERAKREREAVEWSGKNVFQLLSSNISELLERKRDKESGPTIIDTVTSRETATAANDESQADVSGAAVKGAEEKGHEIIAQHCILEHDLDSFNERLNRHLKMLLPGDDGGNNDEKEKGLLATRLSGMLENHRTAALDRTRSDSEARDIEEDTKTGKEKATEENKHESSKKCLSDKQETDASTSDTRKRSMAQKDESGSKPKRGSSKGEMQVCPYSNQHHHGSGGTFLERELSASAMLDWLLGRPFLLVACYALACLHQITGLDFVSALGVLLAAVSVISIYFL